MKTYSEKNDNKQKVSKNTRTLHLIGTLDELNCHLGLIKAMLSNNNYIEVIQKNLMKIMSHVSDRKNQKYLFSKAELVCIETEIERLSKNLPDQTGFIIPGKSIIEAQIHIARTAARKAERYFYAVNEEYSPADELCQESCNYLNRLSDYLFVLSRV